MKLYNKGPYQNQTEASIDISLLRLKFSRIIQSVGGIGFDFLKNFHSNKNWVQLIRLIGGSQSHFPYNDFEYSKVMILCQT